MPAAVGGGSRGKTKPKARPVTRSGPEVGGFLLDAGKLLTARSAGLTPGAASILAGGLAVIGLGVVLIAGGVGAAMTAGVGKFISDRAATAGFTAKDVLIQGAAPFAVEDIRRAAGVKVGEPILGVDLAKVRAQVLNVGWVQDVRVVRLLPNTLVIGVTERRRLAVWQSGGVMRVVDDAGRMIPEADASRFGDLPLIVGQGAPDQANGMLAEIDRRPRLKSRLLALVRVDQRRWDIHLKDGLIIQLPAEGEGDALTRLDGYDARKQILDLGLARIDLRDPKMTVLRRREDAPQPVSADPVAGGI